jgi:hypothetical protein
MARAYPADAFHAPQAGPKIAVCPSPAPFDPFPTANTGC